MSKNFYFFLYAVTAVLLVGSSQAQAKTQMEIYQEASAILFVVDDQPMAILDKEGFHVREGIDYGAALSHEAPRAFDERLKVIGEIQAREANKENAHEE